jgi:multidrug efflux pump subunit AcrA (membrane-fusion protein)
VRATLVLDQADALVVPRQAVIDRDGKNLVYRRVPGGAGGFEPVAVELGPATSGRVVVARGLAAGDVIALRDPTRPVEPAGAGSGSAPERAP